MLVLSYKTVCYKALQCVDLTVARLAHESVAHIVGFGFYSVRVLVSKELQCNMEKVCCPLVFSEYLRFTCCDIGVLRRAFTPGLNINNGSGHALC